MKFSWKKYERDLLMKRISPKALATYEYILERSAEGVPPTVREICSDLGFKSTSTAHKLLVELEDSGYIVRESGLNRNIKVNTEKVLQVPVVGTSISKNSSITAVQNVEGYMPFSAKGYSYGDLFAVLVKGDSMKGIGILDGDTVIAKKTITAKNGEIILVEFNGEAIVRRFKEHEKGFMLKAENPAIESIICDEVVILGKIIACARNYE
jgi:repressor LexA